MVRALSAFVASVILAAGVFFAQEYYNNMALRLGSDSAGALDLANDLLTYLYVLCVVTIFFGSLLMYMSVTTHDAARRLAYRMTKDVYFSQEQFRRFYDFSPVPYLLIGKKSDIVRPNVAALRMLGVTNDELLCKDVFTFFRASEGNDGLIESMRTRVTRRIPIEKQEVYVVASNGIPRWVLLSVEYLKDPNGSYSGLVTVVDIHEQKELDRVKTEFMSLASHQLRAPLANLKWYIDFLLTRRATALTEELKGYLQKMYQRNEDMIDLVNSLLNLSRIEMGRIIIQKEDTDIAALASSVADELEPAAREKQIALVREFSNGLTISTDPKLVRIIIQNLLSNGIRYTPQSGHVTLRVETESRKITIRVIDTGIGIPVEEQSHIFEKMYRASNAKVIEANGNGIGLYMCKALVENLGGTISFKTTLGTGTTFTVELFR